MATKIGSLFGDVSIRTQGLEKGIKKANRMLYKFGRSAQGAGKNITAGVGLPVTAVGVTAFNTFRNFQQEMAKVEAISGATGEEFIALEKLARDLGASTRFTATQVSALQLNLSKLGFSSKEIQNATADILNLSLATGEDLAESARVSAQVLRAFGLDATEMSRVTDVMAKSFSSSALDLMKFDTAMANVGAIAKSTEVPLEEITAMLAVLVDRGIDASSAGTGLRNMFLKLNKHGMSFNEALETINNSIKPASTALRLFGIRGVTVGQTIAGNVEQVKELTEVFANAGGSAEHMAGIMDDTVTGSFFKVQSAIEGVQIALGELTKGFIKPFLDSMANFIQSNQLLIAEMTRTGLVLGGIVTVFGVLLLVLGTLSFAIMQVLGLITLIGIKVVLITLAIGALIAGVIYVSSKLIGFGNTMNLIMNPIETTMFLLKSFGMRMINLGNIVIGVAKQIGLAFFHMGRVVKSIIYDIGQGIATIGDVIAHIFKDGFNPFALKKNASEVGEMLGKAFGEAFSNTTDAFELGMEDLKANSKSLAENLQNDFDNTTNKIISDFNKIGTDTDEGTEKLIENIMKIKTALEGKGGMAGEKQGFWGGFLTSWLEATENIANQSKILAGDMDMIFKKASDNMTDSFMEFFETGKLEMKKMVDDMLRQLQRLVIQKGIVNPLLSAGLGALGNAFGLTFMDNVEVPQGKAKGGTVRAGTPYIVGEQGMELFVPNKTGTIVPNHAMGGNVVVNFNVQATDANSFDQQIAQRQELIVGMIDQAFNKRGKVGIYG